LLHADLSLSFRVVRDLFGKKVDRLWIDSREEYQAVRDFVQRFSPEQLLAFICTTKMKVFSIIWEWNRRWRGPSAAKSGSSPVGIS